MIISTPEAVDTNNKRIAVNLYPNLSANGPIVKHAIIPDDNKEDVMNFGIVDFSQIKLYSVEIVVSRNVFEKCGLVQGQEFSKFVLETLEKVVLDVGVHVKSGAFSKYNPEPPKPLSQNAVVTIRTVMSSVLPMINVLLNQFCMYCGGLCTERYCA